MSENITQEKNLFETLEEKSPEFYTQVNSKLEKQKNFKDNFKDEEYIFEFLVQDMFLDHFFP